jgi:hypothetical protein
MSTCRGAMSPAALSRNRPRASTRPPCPATPRADRREQARYLLTVGDIEQVERVDLRLPIRHIPTPGQRIRPTGVVPLRQYSQRHEHVLQAVGRCIFMQVGQPLAGSSRGGQGRRETRGGPLLSAHVAAHLRSSGRRTASPAMRADLDGAALATPVMLVSAHLNPGFGAGYSLLAPVANISRRATWTPSSTRAVSSTPSMRSACTGGNASAAIARYRPMAIQWTT